MNTPATQQHPGSGHGPSSLSPEAQGRVIGQSVTAMSLMRPQWRCPTAWTEHAPFLFWLVEALEPRLAVELGTHNGYSFFALCQAVQKLGLSTRCVAIDTWTGDKHAGFYSDAVFKSVQAYAQTRYPAIAALKRTTFDAALPDFADGSVDLLHIDGRHFYDDVKHDFESWMPKLSNRAVVLFHDIEVRERDFGVHRLWAQISQLSPAFAFRHCHGLGVLGYGRNLPVRLRYFFEATQAEAASSVVRGVYEQFGQSLRLTWRKSAPSPTQALRDRLRRLFGA